VRSRLQPDIFDKNGLAMKENGQCAKTESVKAMGRLPYDNAGIDDAEPSGYDRSMKTALAKGQKTNRDLRIFICSTFGVG